MGLSRLHRSPLSKRRVWAAGGDEKKKQKQELKGRSRTVGRKAQPAHCKLETSVHLFLGGMAWREQS